MRPIFAMLSCVALAACASAGGASFDLAYPASQPDELTAVAARVRAAPVSAVPSVVVVVPPAPARGFAVFALPDGRRLGQTGTNLLGRPVIAGDVVLARTPGSIVAWNFNGQERWRTPDRGFNLVGAAQDAGRVVITLGGAGVTQRHGALLVLDAVTGTPRFTRLTPHAMGSPALVGRDLFVPWDGQNLSVFDADSGAELARVRGREDTWGFARREGSSVWFGARALYRFGPEVAGGRTDTPARTVFPVEGLPGNPQFMNDPYTTLNAGLDARERVRLAWRPDDDTEHVRFAGDSVYALFHRDVFSLASHDGEVRWAYVHPADIAGIEVTHSGVTVVDENGRAEFIDAGTGRTVWRADLGTPVAQAVLQLPSEFAPSGGVTDEAPLTLVEGLLRAAAGNDTRLMPAQLFAVRALTARTEPAATHALVTVLTHRQFPQELRAAAGEAITHRTNGVEAMLEALNVHADYVRDLEEPPSGMLARGLAAARERRAVPALIGHLHDPATPASDLPAIVSALRELGDNSAVPSLVDFLRLYHADTGLLPPVGGGEMLEDRHVGEQEPLDAALEQAVLAVAAMGGPNERHVLGEIALHPRTARVVREAIERAGRGDTQTTAAATTPGGTDMAFQAQATHVTREQMETSFLPVRHELLDCLRGAPSRPATVRIQFRYENTGGLSHVIVHPVAFQACMAPIVGRVRLPESGVGREIGTYNLSTFP